MDDFVDDDFDFDPEEIDEMEDLDGEELVEEELDFETSPNEEIINENREHCLPITEAFMLFGNATRIRWIGIDVQGKRNNITS